LAQGHAAEIDFLVELRLKSAYKIPLTMQIDDSTGDRLIILPTGTWTIFEVKDDKNKSAITGNIMIEECRTMGRYGKFYKEATGLAVTRADWWAHRAWHGGSLRWFCARAQELKKALMHEVVADVGDPASGPTVKKTVWRMNPDAVKMGLCKDYVSLKPETEAEGNPPTLNIRCVIATQVVGSPLWFELGSLANGSWRFQ
jgi:hypothetical protein